MHPDQYLDFNLNFNSSDDEQDQFISHQELQKTVHQTIKKTQIQHQYLIQKIIHQSQNSTVASCIKKNQGTKYIFKILSNYEQQTDILEKLPPHSNVINIIAKLNSGLLLPSHDGDLRKLIMKTYEPMTIELIFSFLHDVCQGIRHLHSHNIIHGDLKPDNILYKTENTGKISFILCDFGNSFEIGEKNKSNTQTLAYRAPETLKGSANEKIDIWGIGCILYECLTGNPLLPLQLDDLEEYQQYFKMYCSPIHIEGQLNRWTTKAHQKQFGSLLLSLLKIDPQERISLEDIMKIITKHSDRSKSETS